MINSYCQFWGFSQGFSSVSMFLFANTHLNLFIFWLALQVSNHTTINIFFPQLYVRVHLSHVLLPKNRIADYVQVCPTLHTYFFREGKRTSKSSKKPTTIQNRKVSSAGEKKPHQNSITSRRPYLTKLRQ